MEESHVPVASLVSGRGGSDRSGSDRDGRFTVLLGECDRHESMRRLPPLLPEVYDPEAPSFFAWEGERYAAYVHAARQRNLRALTPHEYLVYAMEHYPLADVLLLYWDQQDVVDYCPGTGRPSDGYLDGKLGDDLFVFRVRTERWDLLLSRVPPEETVRPLYPVNGQRTGESIWGRFFRSRQPDWEPNPWWRLHVWTRLLWLYQHVRYDTRHPWYADLARLPLQLPWHDPSPIVAGSCRQLQATLAG